MRMFSPGLFERPGKRCGETIFHSRMRFPTNQQLKKYDRSFKF
jgi:hypothetical protein